eukprot:SAG31_NODE_8679_length_1407_cov_1.637615_1_plen_202_part_10
MLEPSLGDKQITSSKLLRAGLKPVSYSELVEVIKILKVWRDPEVGPGRNERFVGTLLDFFPKHNYAELEYMKQEWGNFGMLLRCSVLGYTEGDHIEAFGHPDNEIKKRRFPLVWTYQPIHEIRDYFGEDTALYYAWLGTYTAALFVASILGIVTMIFQPIYGGVEKNPLTLAYSVYIGLWSVSFIESWRRAEVEYRFLWGSE